MNVVVYDKSKGKCFRKTRRLFSMFLININDREYVGDIPARTVMQLVKDVGRMVGKNSDVLILISKSDGYHGWFGYHFGREECKKKYENFLYK